MALMTTHSQALADGETHTSTFGVGDVVRIHQRLNEPGSEKSRVQIFEGTVIAIRGNGMGKSVVVRRIGAQNVGMELIFPIHAPTIEKIEVSRAGVKGVRHAKLYFIRNQSHREIEKIYSRTHLKDVVNTAKTKKVAKKATSSKRTSK